MKKIMLVLLLFMAGCSTAPLPPEPTGKFTPVNPDEVRLSELKI